MFEFKNPQWTRQPMDFEIRDDSSEIITAPHTDLWQRTYYHFRNDNAPVLQVSTQEKYFSFTVKTTFESKHRFDQCGVVLYLDSDNWLKASIEYENEQFQHLGSVVTNHGYSDWATTAIPAEIKSMWYRLSRREDDFCIECSQDGVNFSLVYSQIDMIIGREIAKLLDDILHLDDHRIAVHMTNSLQLRYLLRYIIMMSS